MVACSSWMARATKAEIFSLRSLSGPGTLCGSGRMTVRSNRLPRMKSSAPDSGVDASSWKPGPSAETSSVTGCRKSSTTW